jgi:dolichol-phosphate mannosyltransferase
MGRLLLLDGLLTFCTTLALFCGFEAIRGERLHRGWWLLAALACGLGALTKGPVALLLLAPPLWLYRWLSGHRVPIRWTALLAFVLLVAAVSVPWYAAICLRIPAFAREFVWDHHVRRFLAPFAHEHGVWFYGPVLFLGLLPGTLLAVPFLRFLLTSDREAARQRTPELGFLLLAGGWCVLFFTLSACKLPTYILPALPPLALAFGLFLSDGPTTWPASVPTRRCPSSATRATATRSHSTSAAPTCGFSAVKTSRTCAPTSAPGRARSSSAPTGIRCAGCGSCYRPT